MTSLEWSRSMRMATAGGVRVLVTAAVWGVTLGLLRAVAPGGSPGALSIPAVVVPYVFYEVVALGWMMLSRPSRSWLAAVGIVAVVGWVALEPVAGLVGVVIAGIFVVALDAAPIERWLDAIVRAWRLRRPTGRPGFGPPPADDPTTRRYPHAFEASNDRRAVAAGTCPDCGDDLRQLLVGRACPNCGAPVEAHPPE